MSVCHILAVDDEPINLALFKAFFFAQPYEVTLCSSGARAIQMLDDPEQSIDVLVLDLMMPNVDGFDVLRAVRAHARRWSVPVIVQSGNGDQEFIRKAMEAGADDYLVKPFLVDTLMSVLDRLRPSSGHVA
ncbi:response regulator [Uliginosibacterium sp. H3]|uniref:Response regulator n=1 Tax=Uliginosibacterium silvisoli TaxID=3114758 RepID=A0ABU6K1E1_9RHOO|nr:response regulator [Uliginosibacterium sp. H3]